MADQNATRSSRRPTGGRLGERSAWRVLFADRRRPDLLIVTLRFGKVFRRPIESAPYLSITCSKRLALAGVGLSVGIRGDSCDNALAETIIGLFKTKAIYHLGYWAGMDDVEFATLCCV